MYVDGKFIVFGSNVGNYVCIYLLGNIYGFRLCRSDKGFFTLIACVYILVNENNCVENKHLLYCNTVDTKNNHANDQLLT